jgi:hypothetical protein
MGLDCHGPHQSNEPSVDRALDELKGAEASVLEQMVSSHELRFESEDVLLDFVWSLDLVWSLDREDEIVLLRYLRSEYLSGARWQSSCGIWQIPILIV